MEIILTSLLAFISTNLDDVFLLMLLFGDRRSKRYQIVAGQFLGIALLIALSVAGSFLGLVIDVAYIGWLGFFPIYIGIKGLLRVRAGAEASAPAEPRKSRSNILAVTGITVANGGDNIGVYVPLFAVLAWHQKILMILIFMVMTAIWCLLARYLAQHPLIASVLKRYGPWATPFVLILLGFHILYQSGTLAMLRQLIG